MTSVKFNCVTSSAFISLRVMMSHKKFYTCMYAKH